MKVVSKVGPQRAMSMVEAQSGPSGEGEAKNLKKQGL